MTATDALLALTRHRRAALWVFVLALTVRGGLLVGLHDSYYTSGMAQGELARNLAEGRGFVVNGPLSDSVGAAQWREERLIDIGEAVARWPANDDRSNLRPFIAYMMPGQGMLLAGTYLVTGEYRYLPLQIVQVVVDALGVFLIVWMGTVLFSRTVGLLAALVFAVYIPEARLVVTATRDAWMPMVYLVSAALAVRAWKSGTTRDYVWLGGAVAVGAYFRSEILLLPVWVGLAHLAAGLPLRTFALRAAAGLLPALVLLTPWTVRNYQVFDRVIPTNSGLWLAMWQSFGEYENPFGAVNNDVVTMQQMRAAGHTEAFDTPEYDDLFRPKVLEVLAAEPGWFVWTVARRVVRIPFQMHAWGLPATDDLHGPSSPYPTGSVDTEAYIRLITSDPVRLVVHGATRGINLVLYAALALWFILMRRGDWRPGLMLAAVPLYNIAVHAVIGVHARYILPTNAVHLLFVATLAVRWLERRGRPAVTAS